MLKEAIILGIGFGLGTSIYKFLVKEVNSLLVKGANKSLKHLCEELNNGKLKYDDLPEIVKNRIKVVEKDENLDEVVGIEF